MAPGLRLTVLVNNTTLTDRYFTAEPALSFLLKTGGKKILFDTGYTGLFLANAGKMGLDPKDLDTVVLSHGHLDHTGGRVAAIIGGLHLIAPSPSRLTGTGEYLQALGLQALYPCHCTDLASRIALAGYCPVQDVGCG